VIRRGSGSGFFALTYFQCPLFDLSGIELKIQSAQPRNEFRSWINQSTYLPVQARSVDSLPTSLAPSGGLETDTTYKWVPPTSANLDQLTPSIPAGFAQLSGPPPQSPPTTPGVG